MSNLSHDILLSFVHVHLLHHAAQGPSTRQGMSEALARRGYEVGAGKVDAVLRALETAGYVGRELATSGGDGQMCYQITPAGEEVLAHLRPRVQALRELVLGDSPDSSPSGGALP